jgi:hypothetical protein
VRVVQLFGEAGEQPRAEDALRRVDGHESLLEQRDRARLCGDAGERPGPREAERGVREQIGPPELAGNGRSGFERVPGARRLACPR